MRVKKILSFLIPKRLSFGIDNVEAPSYTMGIEGGVLMNNKNEIVKKENSVTDAIITTVGELSTTIKTAISEPEITQREEFIGFISVIKDAEISQEDRSNAITAMNKSMDYRQARFMTKEENRQRRFMARQEAIIRLAPYITVAVLGIAALSSGVACCTIYSAKKAA